jgi:hypothetical protein
MEASPPDTRRRAPERANIRGVVAAALGTYRRCFGRIVVTAILVFAPIDLVVTLATMIAKDAVEHADVMAVTLWVAGTVVSVTGTMLSLVFFAGVIDRLVAVDQYGEDYAPLFHIVRNVPTVRLIVASLLAAGLIIAGILLFVVPGLLLMVLLCVVGPVVVIEHLHPWAACLRSAKLVWPHSLLATTVVLLPTVLEEELTSWLETLSWYESPLPHLTIDVGSTILVGGLIGVIEVTLAHALIADYRRRREAAAKQAHPEAAGIL